jgi:hypothetical protein
MGGEEPFGSVLERFQAKWLPVRVKQTRQINNPEPRFDSIETEKALVAPARAEPVVGPAGGRTRWLGCDDDTYEIPITLLVLPPRKSMRRVAPLNPAKAGRQFLSRPADRRAQEPLMLDIIMLALGLSFFVVGIGYAYACERL